MITIVSPLTARIAGKLLSEYVPIGTNRCFHHSLDDVIGYVVRETIRNGQVIYNAATGRVGHDQYLVEGATNYAETFPLRDEFRNQPRGYAVADSLYRCGCRSY